MLEIVLHCSDSTWGNAAIIDGWHRQRNFKMIGYHFVFLNGRISSGTMYNARLDGLKETGRPIGALGAHTIGKNNAVGICLIGTSNNFTASQITVLKEELKELATEHGGVIVTQHSDHDKNKPFCAGFTQKQMQEFNDYANSKEHLKSFYPHVYANSREHLKNIYPHKDLKEYERRLD